MPKTKMTVARFMKELAKHKGEFKFVDSWRLRTEGVDAEGGTKHCPITRVCQATTGEDFSIGGWLSAAQKIGMHPKTAGAIMDAADSNGWGTPARDAYRRQMLKVLGLKESD